MKYFSGSKSYLLFCFILRFFFFFLFFFLQTQLFIAAMTLSLSDQLEGNAVRPHNGRSALHLASFRGHYDVVKHLVEDGFANKYLQDNVGEVCFVLLFDIGGGGVFKITDFFSFFFFFFLFFLFLSSHLSFLILFSLLQTPITSAVRGRHPEIMKFLLLEVDDSMKADHALTEVRWYS